MNTPFFNTTFGLLICGLTFGCSTTPVPTTRHLTESDLLTNPRLLLQSSFSAQSVTVGGVRLGDPATKIPRDQVYEKNNQGFWFLKTGARYKVSNAVIVTLGLDTRFQKELGIHTEKDIVSQFGEADRIETLKFEGKPISRAYVYTGKQIYVSWTPLTDSPGHLLIGRLPETDSPMVEKQFRAEQSKRPTEPAPSPDRNPATDAKTWVVIKQPRSLQEQERSEFLAKASALIAPFSFLEFTSKDFGGRGISGGSYGIRSTSKERNDGTSVNVKAESKGLDAKPDRVFVWHKAGRMTLLDLAGGSLGSKVMSLHEPTDYVEGNPTGFQAVCIYDENETIQHVYLWIEQNWTYKVIRYQ